MVHEDVAYPISLEAILRAEVTAFDVQLQTGRALQGASFIIAICPTALFLGI
jgi:formyltetrahydrofolate synthetase